MTIYPNIIYKSNNQKDIKWKFLYTLQKGFYRELYLKQIIVNMTIAYLEKALKDVVPRGNRTQFVSPGFENFRVVYRKNSVITIIPKGDRHVR